MGREITARETWQKSEETGSKRGQNGFVKIALLVKLNITNDK